MTPSINNYKIPLWNLDGKVTLNVFGSSRSPARMCRAGLCAPEERLSRKPWHLQAGARNGQISIPPHPDDSLSSISQWSPP